MIAALNVYFHNRNIAQRLLCFLLSILIIILCIYVQYQEAYAFAPALVLAGYAVPEAVTIVGTLLCAAGLTWAGQTAIDATSDWFYANCTPAIKQGIADMIGTASNGIAQVSDEVWNYARDWVQAHYAVGENTITTHYYDATLQTTVGSDIYTNYLPANYAVPYTEFPVVLPSTFTVGLDTYEIVVSDYIGTNKRISLKKNGVNHSSAMTITVNTAVSWGVYLDATNDYGTTHFRLRVRSAGYNRTAWDDIDTYWPSLGNDTIGMETVPGTAISTPVTGADVLSNPMWDIKKETGERTIGYPTTLDDLVGKTYDDVDNPAGTADPPIAEPDNTFKYPSFKVPADIIKNKFPFSIPWDLKNAITSLTATPKAPKWTINFDSRYFAGGGQIEIDFAQFEAWAKIVRWGVLIIFNITLILITRKIIGAGGGS